MSCLTNVPSIVNQKKKKHIWIKNLLNTFLLKVVDVCEMYTCDIRLCFIRSCMKKLLKHFKMGIVFFPMD
jgi:hypothetical protein